MKYLLLILLLLIPSIASACESYEECIETAKWSTNQFGDDNGPQDELAYAIAYKLDEISNKLDRAESNTPVDIIASQIRKGDK